MSISLKRNFPIQELVLQLRAQAPVFEKRVAWRHALGDDAFTSLNLDAPYLIVQKTGSDGYPPDRATATQRRESQISIIICADNTRQKGKGTGAEAYKVGEQVELYMEAVENAMLNWEPQLIDLADRPSFIAEGVIAGNNTKLWYEMVWSIPYSVYNPAFRGLGSQAIDDDANEKMPTITELSIHYGVTPEKLFLDEWIYGPQTNPDPSEDSVIDADNIANALIYEIVDGEFIMVNDKQKVLRDMQTRSRRVLIIDGDITYYPPTTYVNDPGYAMLYSFDGIGLTLANGWLLQLSGAAPSTSYETHIRTNAVLIIDGYATYHEDSVYVNSPGYFMLYTSDGQPLATSTGSLMQVLDDYL